MIEDRILTLSMEPASAMPAMVREIVADIGYASTSAETKERLFAMLARQLADQIGALADEVDALEVEAVSAF